MSRIRTFYRSSLGKKAVMAVTGFVLFGFVVGHMLGNLHLYQGAAKMNEYAVFLREFGEPLLSHGQALWAVRIILLTSVTLHIGAAVQLARENHRARPVGYRVTKRIQTSYASRTMIWSGPILALFVVYHILHLTTGTVHHAFNPDDVYRNVVTGFSVWYVSAFYMAAMGALGLHMIHGVWSLFQSLGVNGTRWNHLLRDLAAMATAAVVAGNLSFPISVLLGIVR